MRFLSFFCLLFFLIGCSKSDFVTIANVATSKNISTAAKRAATANATQYAKNPETPNGDYNSLKLSFH